MVFETNQTVSLEISKEEIEFWKIKRLVPVITTEVQFS